MASNDTEKKIPRTVSAQPRLHQRGAEIQAYGTVNHLLPLELEEPVRLEMTALLNQLLADTMTLRDLYKKRTGRSSARRSISCICCSTNISMNRPNWLTRSPSVFSFLAA